VRPPAPPPPPASEIPTLVAGAGFEGATSPSPAGPIGSGTFDDATVCSRWIDLPYQERSADFVLCIPAFHGAGTDYLEVRLDGGATITLTDADLGRHPVTRYWGYLVRVPAASLADGLHEVRCFAYPNRGYPRSLSGPLDTSAAAQVRGEHSFFFYTDVNETLARVTMWVDVDGEIVAEGTEEDPFRYTSDAYVAAIAALGGGDPAGFIHIRMKSAGSYGWPNTYNQYDNPYQVYLEGNPSLAKTACVIDTMDFDPPRGFQTQRVTVRNCTIGAINGRNDGNDCMLCLDGYVIAGAGYNSVASPFDRGSWSLGIHGQDALYRDMKSATIEMSLLVRYEIRDIGEDFLREPRGWFVDGYCHTGRQPVPNHANLIQHAGSPAAENVCFYGLRSRNIGLTGELPDAILVRNLIAVGVHKDWAFVNVELSVGGNSLLQHSANHLLLWYVTHARCQSITPAATGVLSIADDPPDSPATNIPNLSIRNSTIKQFSITRIAGDPPAPGTIPAAADTSWADNNHFETGDQFGTGATGGSDEASMFVDAANNDRTPKATGPLVNRVATPLVGVDANWELRGPDGAIGAYKAAAE
jgi:hypothetical protein